MPTARELLEQAEALMRRDRMAALAADDDFPVLTDAVDDAAPDAGVDVAVAGGTPTPDAAPPSISEAASDAATTEAAAAAIVAEAREAEIAVAEAPHANGHAPASAMMPVVDDVAEPAAPPPPVAPPPPLPAAPPPDPAIARLVQEQAEVAADEQGEPSIWAVPAAEAEALLSDLGPDSEWPLPFAPTPGMGQGGRDADALWRDEPSGAGTAKAADSSSGGADAAAEAATQLDEAIAAPVDDFPLDATLDATRWNLMAEDIRMQVLQRIDIFTDTGLREQLTARLQPAVDRASAELVAAINQHVGQILRAYVAEAIEREIEKWRQEPR